MQERSLFTHILVPTDGSESSIHSGRLAIQMASDYGAKVTLVYVVDSATVDEIAGATSKSRDAIGHEMEVKGRSYLEYLARLASGKDIQPEQVIRLGIPYQEITDLARACRVDLVVMGRVGCRGARCALVGHIAERVIELSPCPVLVVTEPSGRR